MPKIKRPAPNLGWDIIEFVDGYEAQIAGATLIEHDGVPWVKLYMKPFPDLIKMYDIKDEDLDSQLCLERMYPEDTIILLNEHDPARKKKFCLLNFNGEVTKVTERFNGYQQIREIQRLKKEIESLKIQIAKLKTENILIQTDVQKYLNKNLSPIMKLITPILKETLEEKKSSTSSFVPIEKI